MNKKLITAVCIILAVITVSAVAFDSITTQKTTEKTVVAMGSVLSVKIYGKADDDVLDDIAKKADETEKTYLSRYVEGSEIYRLNETGSGNNEYIAGLLKRSADISKDSGGAFDITIGKLTSLWDFDNETNTIPEKNSIEELLPYCGCEKLKINGSFYSEGKNQAVDMGAVGKGTVCDEAAAILEKHNVKNAIVSFGGTVLIYGKAERKVAIRTPEKNNTSNFAVLKTGGNKFISTSGNYEKSFEKDGKIYHHILDPKTGMPAESGLLGVTVIAGSGFDADALSTACFVLGYEDSIPLLKKYGAEAVFVTNDKKVYTTDSISVELINDEYSYGN